MSKKKALAQRLITDVDKALDAADTYQAPAVIVTKKGNLKCPWCKQRVNEGEIIELDCSIRWNRGTFEADAYGGTISISPGDSDYSSFGYMTECCMALVSLPEGIEVAW